MNSGVHLVAPQTYSPYVTDFVSNDVVRSRMDQPLLSDTILRRRLSFLANSVVPTRVKTTIELFRPAFGVLPKTGDAEPVDRGKPGCWERLRTICARLISAWRRQGGALWKDRHGVNSWRRQAATSTWHAPERREHYVIVRPLSTVGYTSVVASVIHSRQCMV